MESQHFCRSCKLPLTIDASLQNLTPAQKNLLQLKHSEKPGSNYNELANNNEYAKLTPEKLARFEAATGIRPPSMERASTETKNDQDGSTGNSSSTPTTDRSNNHNSFVYLDDKGLKDEEEENMYMLDVNYNHNKVDNFDDKKTNISERVDMLSKIFDIVSLQYDLDYPVCSDCAMTLIKESKNKFETLNKEKEVYLQFLKKMTTQNSPNHEKIEAAVEDHNNLESEKTQILEQLDLENKKHLDLKSEIDDLEKEIRDLELEEIKMSIKWNKKEMKLQEEYDELAASKAKYNMNLDTLDMLRKTDLFNNIFGISHDGSIGTINGLRLGCLEDVKVTWPEINAALGQLVLMMNTTLTIAHKSLRSYRLLPMGSRSRIEITSSPPKIMSLYASGNPLGSSIGGLLGNALGSMFSSPPLSIELSHLDKAVRELAEISECVLPHKAPLQFDRWLGWEHWSEQLRLLLGNAHWIFGIVVAQHSPM